MTEYPRASFAGFWERFIAFIIDVLIVSLIVFPFALAIGLKFPNAILVEVPFDLFTTTTIVSENETEKSTIEKDDVLGLWTNFYKVEESEDDFGDKTTLRTLVDPTSHKSIHKTTSSDIEFYIIFIYWILLEASIWQGSLGKRIMGLQVVTQDGGKPNVFQCAARNLLKILSGLILFIGFFMAGWTDKKQALHDKIPNLLVIKKHKKLSADNASEASS